MSANDDCYASPALISVDEALALILDGIRPVSEIEHVSLDAALGRVLAQTVQSGIDVPGYDNSAMDGYAVRSADIVTAGAVLPVLQRIAAGYTGTALTPGTAARIFTGAPLPAGADAVVMQELCDRQGENVIINTRVEAGENVRRAGEDIAQGADVLVAGSRLRPQELGLLASIGTGVVPVSRRLKVATFFTGDELVEPGAALAPGQIYNSNRYTLKGLLTTLDCDIIDLGLVPDTLEATVDTLQQAALLADVVITSGGVSVGEEDYVRLALQQLGELTMWRIAMKPGKPVAFGRIGETLFMGLPGNPVSVFVTFLLFARPLLLKLQGAGDVNPIVLRVRSGFDRAAVNRQEYLRVRLQQGSRGSELGLHPRQGSGVLSSASWADGLAVMKIGDAVAVGDMLDYLPFEGLF
jgi:molybdopterin molybdotransferase